MADAPNFRDADHLYEVFDRVLKDLLSDPDLGPKLAKSNMIIRWVYHEPDATVTFNFKDAPREGYAGDWAFGECDWTPDVTTYQSAAFGLSFLQGMENPMVAVTRGKVKAKGNITSLMKMLPVARAMPRRVRKTLYQMGEEDLVIKKKK